MTAGALYFAITLLLTGTRASPLARRLDNGVGTKPALGWNNYNAGLSASAESALVAANAFVQLGLKDLGYTYINLDDGWSTVVRDSDGNLVPDPSKFPNGMKNVSDQIHALDLMFGLYGGSGTATCAGFPGFVIGLVAADGAGTLSASFADVPDLGAGTYSWTELYSGKTGSGDGVSWMFEVEHDMAISKVTGKVPSTR